MNKKDDIPINDGNCIHEIWCVPKDIHHQTSYAQCITKKGVWLNNQSDDHYQQCFQTVEELNNFINELIEARKVVFGE